MSDSGQIAGLESALLARAQRLADEYLASGRQAHQHILDDARQRLRIEEEREVLAAKAHAERVYQQRVQAAELSLHAEFDRARWSLVHAVLDVLPARLAELAQDESRYLALLLGWLREGAQAIEREQLVVSVNPRDLPLLRRDWQRYGNEAAPDKHLELSEQTIACMGGILISSGDGNIRLDNTFEGRMERLGEALQRAVADRLIPAGEAHGG
ncbi:MAG: V-type ATP synthase subunit E [Gallionellaceae bacterium]